MTPEQINEYVNRDHAADVELAAQRLEGVVRHTHLEESQILSDRIGARVLLKPENLQKTGSFKLRGAYNKIASLSQEDLDKGIVTASAGNHAQGVAYAARERGAQATIVMPRITPPIKVDATRALGAKVALVGDVFDESSAHAAKLSEEQGLIFVHPFNDYEVLTGQGTIALEILQDCPEVTDILVPLGGGGLGAGIAMAVKAFAPHVRVIGVTPEGSQAFKQSFSDGQHEVHPASSVHTAAEGVAVKQPGDLTFALLEKYLDGFVTVTERDISEMILLMLEKHKLVVEAAGAVSLAALNELDKVKSVASLENNGTDAKLLDVPDMKNRVIVPILSGGNIDTVTIGAVIQRGMITRGRIMQFGVELPDTPGQLALIAQILADLRANVIELNHDQFKAQSHYTNTVLLEVTVETNGPEHIQQVLDALQAKGFRVNRVY
ncbi:threonine ammonia-lyase [Alloscardovia theropitheci]|uniref:threonine ammonia-lyase n=1 Tax=Alloscardovia theropitheci TaxID=2496842 RepID=A0A4R0R088_9BIFI|nr:pyridoxal-phosphate dependent enzyme [Alloscardovia theropitheci]TCD54416.1 threonine ammonia-lyase [Alloscardovia theropitheci]